MADWIQWFCSMEGHDFFCEVDRSFIGTIFIFSRARRRRKSKSVLTTTNTKKTESRFNLYGINTEVTNFNEGLNIILDYVSSDSSSADDWNRDDWSRKEWMDLYGRIHARFILTARGQQLMLQKYLSEEFGRCPRVYCEGHPVLPVGLSNKPGKHRVMAFCPKCQDVFIPPNTLAARYVDGAYFGSTFPHFFLMQYPDHVPPRPDVTYSPRIFGYKIHSSSPAFQAPVAAIKDSTLEDKDQKNFQTNMKNTKKRKNDTADAMVIEELDDEAANSKVGRKS